MDQKEKLLEGLACFACDYRDDCLEDFDRTAGQCKSMLEKAEVFAKENLSFYKM